MDILPPRIKPEIAAVITVLVTIHLGSIISYFAIIPFTYMFLWFYKCTDLLTNKN